MSWVSLSFFIFFRVLKNQVNFSQLFAQEHTLKASVDELFKEPGAAQNLLLNINTCKMRSVDYFIAIIRLLSDT